MSDIPAYITIFNYQPTEKGGQMILVVWQITYNLMAHSLKHLVADIILKVVSTMSMFMVQVRLQIH